MSADPSQERHPFTVGRDPQTHAMDSANGRRCRDTFTRLKKTCRELGVSFWSYLNDRVSNADRIPPLPDLIRARARSAWMGSQCGLCLPPHCGAEKPMDSTSEGSKFRGSRFKGFLAEMIKLQRLEDLEAWQLARVLTQKVYHLTKKPDFSKNDGLKR